MNLIIQEKNQHSNWRRPSGDPTSVILQTSKSWRKMLRDLKRDVKRKGNFSWSFQACPIWWRGESVKCEYVWSEIQQLPLSAGVPSDRDLTSSWRKAVSCGHEVLGSDPKVLTAEKWDMTVFLMCVFRTMWKAFGRTSGREMIMGIYISSISYVCLGQGCIYWNDLFNGTCLIVMLV